MASESTSADSEGSIFQVLEGVVYYVDSTTSSNAMNVLVGSKEHVSIPLSGKHCSLQAFVKRACGRTCMPQEGSSKTRSQVQNRYKTMRLRKRTRWYRLYRPS